MWRGRSFQTVAPETGNARLPTVERRTGGTSRRCEVRPQPRLDVMSETQVKHDCMDGEDGEVPCLNEWMIWCSIWKLWRNTLLRQFCRAQCICVKLLTYLFLGTDISLVVVVRSSALRRRRNGLRMTWMSLTRRSRTRWKVKGHEICWLRRCRPRWWNFNSKWTKLRCVFQFIILYSEVSLCVVFHNAILKSRTSFHIVSPTNCYAVFL